MNKHLWALSGAFIGLGIGCFFLDGLSYLPIIYGLCIGGFLGYLISGFIGAKGKMLQEDFQNLGDLRGLTIEEICSHVGMYNSSNSIYISDRQENGMLYTWIQNNYIISLLFGADGKCIGVQNEITA